MMADSITGLSELLSAMKHLDARTQKKIAPKMVSAAARIVRTEAKAIASSKGLRKTGDMIRNIALKRERNAPSGTTQYNVGVRHGRSAGKKVIKYVEKSKRGKIVLRRRNDPFYYRFLEFGTKYIRANPFLRPALENKRNEAIRAMETALEKELQKVVR